MDTITRQSGVIDPKLIESSLNFYGLPTDYSRTFGKNGSFGHYSAEKAAQLNIAMWVQMNIPHVGLGIEKAHNKDIATVINITLDAEYPSEPIRAHRVGLELRQQLVAAGYADRDLPIEDSGAGFHIVLPVVPIDTNSFGGGEAVNKAVALFVEETVKSLFEVAVKNQGLDANAIKLEAFDISRILSCPGSWRPGGSKPNEAEYLLDGYVRRWLPPYSESDSQPIRKPNQKLHNAIVSLCEGLNTNKQDNITPVFIDGSTDVPGWINEYASLHPMGELDRSSYFQRLVNATYLRWGETAVTSNSSLINQLSGNKFNGRLEVETNRSLKVALQIPREDNKIMLRQRSTKTALPTVAEVLTQPIPELPAQRDKYLQQLIAAALEDENLGPTQLKTLKEKIATDFGLNKGEVNEAFKQVADDSDSGSNSKIDPLAIAKVLAEKYKDAMAYNDTSHYWLIWSKDHWIRIDDSSSSTAIDRYVSDAIVECGHISRSSLMNDVNRHARMLMEREVNPKPGLVNFSNGTLEISTMLLRDYDKLDGLDYVLPYAYQTEADCPEFKKYLIDRVPDPQARLTIAEHLGLAFMRDHSIHKALILMGAPGAGKSLMLDICLKLFGHNPGAGAAKTIFTSEQEGIRSRYEWQDEAICTIDEVPTDSFAKEEENVKRLIAHGGSDARGMHQNAKSRQWQPKIIMTCNDQPKFKDSSGAIKRRFMFIKFGEAINPKNYDLLLLDKITPELGAIARLCIEAGKGVYVRNAYTVSRKMEITLDTICQEGDILKQFVAERAALACEDKKAADSYTVGGPELYAAFGKWCEDNGIRNVPTKPRVKKDLLAYAAWKLQDKRSAFGLVWVGIRLLDPTNSEDAKRYDNPPSLEERIILDSRS